MKEVKNGLECGISFKDFIDFKEKDIIESYQIEKKSREPYDKSDQTNKGYSQRQLRVGELVKAEYWRNFY